MIGVVRGARRGIGNQGVFQGRYAGSRSALARDGLEQHDALDSVGVKHCRTRRGVHHRRPADAVYAWALFFTPGSTAAAFRRDLALLVLSGAACITGNLDMVLT